MTKKDLFTALDNAYIAWQKTAKAGCNDGNALMFLGRIVMSKAEVPKE